METRHLSPHMKEFYAYWRSLPRAKGEIVPERHSINPFDFKHLLPFFFLSEWIDDSHIINKITGTSLDELLGANLTGVNFLKNYEGDRLKFYKHYWSTLRQTPCGAQLDRNILLPNGQIYKMDALHLPLYDKKGDITFFCGVIEGRQTFYPDDTDKPFEMLNKTKISRLSFIDIGAGLPDNPPDIEFHNSAK